ncbi:MAG: tetratricopeptide repeat protein, partial [Flavisolibacter sp.]
MICISLLFMFACNDNETANHPLSRPPYNKITDSINNAPNDADLYFRRGSLLYSNNQNVYAEKDFLKAWELQTKEEYAVGLTAILKQKHVDTAITFLHEALKKLPNNVFLQIALARGYQQKQQLDKAIEVSNQIISQFPNSIDALMLKAQLLKQQNRYGEAVKALEQAYLYAPGDVELVHTLAFDY